MKSPLHMLLILCVAMMLTACGGEAEAQMPPGFTFTYNSIEIAMKAPAQTILSSLGQPINYTEETSCAFDGLDKTYYYGSFYLTTYPIDGADYIHSLWFADDSVATAEGIAIGASQSDVETAYGTEGFNGSNAYVLTQGETKLTIILTDGVVSSVQYEAIFD